MEVGEETADPFKFVGGINEGGGGALVGGEGGGGLEDAGGGGTHGDEFVSGCSLFGEASWDFVVF